MVARRRRDPDAAMIARAPGKLEGEIDRPTREPAQDESFGEPREHAAQHERKGFEHGDGMFEIHRFAQLLIARFGERCFDFASLGTRHQRQNVGPETLRQCAAGKRQ